MGHLVHGIRSNYPIAFVLHNNGNYGLTTGQASSLTQQGQPMNSSPQRHSRAHAQLHGLRVQFGADLRRSRLVGDIDMMTKVLKAAIGHRGFAFVDILQACPTYNDFATHSFLMERCYDANAEGHLPDDFAKARALALDTSKRIACGVLFQREDIPSFYESWSRGRTKDDCGRRGADRGYSCLGEGIRVAYPATMRRAFTLIELLVVIGTISILSTMTIVAVAPRKNLGEATDAKGSTILKNCKALNINISLTMACSLWIKHCQPQKHHRCLSAVFQRQTLPASI